MLVLLDEGPAAASEQDVICSQRVAKTLWLFSAALLALLLAWSTGPYWPS